MYSPCLFRLRLLLAYIASLTLKSWLCKKSAYSSNPSLVLQRRWKSLSFQRGLQKKHPALLYHLDSQFCIMNLNNALWYPDISNFQFLYFISLISGENLSLFNLNWNLNMRNVCVLNQSNQSSYMNAIIDVRNFICRFHLFSFTKILRYCQFW